MEPSAQPRVRAWWSQTTLARIRAVPEATVLEQAIGSELLTLIDRSGRLDWLPMTTHAACCDRVIAKLGAASFVAILSAPEADPVFAANLKARVEVVGDNPLQLMRHTASTWAEVATDAGILTVIADGPRAATLSFEDLPPTAARLWFKLSFQALIQRALRATGVNGKIEASSSAALRTLSLRASW